ncbi:MAG: 7-carboxy-7-deazaguanine synthase QueE [Cytophagales bacterium]|nr:MAG: 7-carboxy-7-deazaguanine synthase QueE [Cytophagales bacterium]
MNLQTLPVMEHFYTIQGEGAFAGHAAYFVRLAGCDVGCHWCDVKESWDAKNHPQLSVNQIVELVKSSTAKLVVVTGGEPLMHNLEELTKALKTENIRTHIETSGAYPITGTWDWITLSPKKFKMPLAKIYELTNELKVIIFNNSDFNFALDEQLKIKLKNCKFYLQSEWDKKDINYSLITDFVKKNQNWQISVQTHKYLNIP